MSLRELNPGHSQISPSSNEWIDQLVFKTSEMDLQNEHLGAAAAALAAQSQSTSTINVT